MDAAARKEKAKAEHDARRFALALAEEERELARRYRRRAAPHSSMAHASNGDATVDLRSVQARKAMIEVSLDMTTG